MKTALRYLGIIAVAAIIIWGMTACGDPANTPANNGSDDYWNVTWYLNGGAAGTGAQHPARIAKGAVLAEPVPEPVKGGFDFTGWFTDSGLAAAYDFSQPVSGNLQLYAKWVASPPRYLAFTADVHWAPVGTTSDDPYSDIYEKWMEKLPSKVGYPIDYIGYAGDHGQTRLTTNKPDLYWDFVGQLMDLAQTYVRPDFIKYGNLFGLGNHEWYNTGIGGGDFINPNYSTGPAQDRLWLNHEKIVTKDYIIYALGPIGTGTEGYGCTQQFEQGQINILSSYLETAPPNVPIFIMAHHPIHSYGNRITKNGEALLTMLNDYPNVIFLWAHNHQHNDSYYNSVKVAGNSIQVADANGNSSSFTTQPINFTYLSAGCMRDAENGSQAVLTKGVVAKIEGGQVTLTYYDKNCEVHSTATVTVQGGGPVIPGHIVTFDKNGGDTNANPQTIKVSDPATTVGTLPAPPPRAGYTFTGWNTQMNGSGAAFTGTTTVTAAITVYAQWQEKPFTSGDRYTVDLTGQTTKVQIVTSNVSEYRRGFGIKLDFPPTFNIMDYTKVTFKFGWYQGSNPNTQCATNTNSTYFDSYFFTPWNENWWTGNLGAATSASNAPANLQRFTKQGTCDSNAWQTNNDGFTFDISALTTLPAGYWFNKNGGNSFGTVEVLKIRFHNDP